MATTDSFLYAPSLGELVLYAFNMAGVRNTALTQEHMFNARMAANMMQSSWANSGVNLWAVDLVTVPFVQTPTILTASVSAGIATLTYAAVDTPIYAVDQDITVADVSVSGYNGTYTVVSAGPGTVSYALGALANGTGGTISTSAPTSTYAVDHSTIMVLDAYLSIVQSGAPPIDRIILPISRSEWASYPNKTQSGFTTVFWFDRLIAPTITLWPVPDGTSAQYLKYYRVRQIQDAEFAGGAQPEVPFRFLDAYADGMAYRLSKIFNPGIAPALKAVYDESFALATKEDVEQVAYYISPQIGGYYSV